MTAGKGAVGEQRGWRRFSPGAAAILFALWILLSGKLDPFHLAIGLLVVAFVSWQHSRLPATPGHDSPRLRPFQSLLYGFWLFWQMIVSAVYVARVIIWPSKHLDPLMIAFRSEQPTLLHSVILANSITLTPGTLTVDLEENRFLVHALTPATADDVLGGEMAARVARLDSDTPIPSPEKLSSIEEPPAS